MFRKGTTSACAENTDDTDDDGEGEGNYLRVRGEYNCTKPAVILLMELPPRARRIPSATCLVTGGFGTTSACAENTGYNRVV